MANSPDDKAHNMPKASPQREITYQVGLKKGVIRLASAPDKPPGVQVDPSKPHPFRFLWHAGPQPTDNGMYGMLCFYAALCIVITLWVALTLVSFS